MTPGLWKTWGLFQSTRFILMWLFRMKTCSWGFYLTFPSLSSELIAEYSQIWEALVLANTSGLGYGSSIAPYYFGRTGLQGAHRTHLQLNIPTDEKHEPWCSPDQFLRPGQTSSLPLHWFMCRFSLYHVTSHKSRRHYALIALTAHAAYTSNYNLGLNPCFHKTGGIAWMQTIILMSLEEVCLRSTF